MLTDYYRADFGNFYLDVFVSSDDIELGEKQGKNKRDILKNKLRSELIEYHGGESINYKKIVITKLPQCEGCRYDSNGQDAHMNEGGCLFV